MSKGETKYAVVRQQNGGSLVVAVEPGPALREFIQCTEITRVSVKDGRYRYITWDVRKEDIYDDVEDAIEAALGSTQKAAKPENKKKTKKSS